MNEVDVSVDAYLDKHHILTYLQDAVEQLLEYKDDDPKVNITRFLCDYFTSVKEGNHTLFRDYEFVKSTPHNRASFISLFLGSFRQVGKRGDRMKIEEYYALVKLLCSDFPFTMVQKAARIILLEDAMDSLVSFSDFMYAFQIQFYYEDFLCRVEELYRTLASSPPKDTVVVPTSETQATPPHGDAERMDAPTDSVDATHFYKTIVPLVEKATFSCPSAANVQKVLCQTPRVSYYSFLMNLARSEEINDELGVLPHRDDLYSGLTEPGQSDILTPPPSSRRKKKKSTSKSPLGLEESTAYTAAAVSRAGDLKAASSSGKDSMSSIEKQPSAETTAAIGVSAEPKETRSVKVEAKLVNKRRKARATSSSSASDEDSSSSSDD